MSLFSILGRCVLTPDVFDILENLEPGFGGEIQLTDAMRQLAHRGNMMGVDYVGTRYDMGNKLGILQANCEVALKRDDLSADFAAYLKELVKTLP